MGAILDRSFNAERFKINWRETFITSGTSFVIAELAIRMILRTFKLAGEDSS